MATETDRILYSAETFVVSGYTAEFTNLSNFNERYNLAKAAVEEYKEVHEITTEILYRFQFTYTGTNEESYQIVLDKVEDLLMDGEIVLKNYKVFSKANATGITIYYAY